MRLRLYSSFFMSNYFRSFQPVSPPTFPFFVPIKEPSVYVENLSIVFTVYTGVSFLLVFCVTFLTFLFVMFVNYYYLES